MADVFARGGKPDGLSEAEVVFACANREADD